MHFRTPYQGGGIRTWHIATRLVEMGLDCEVITVHDRSSYEVHVIDNVRVHYLPVKYSNHFGFVKRAFAFWKFNILTTHLLKRIPKPDYLYAVSTPLTVGKVALDQLKKNKVEYFFEIGDLWPEAPIQMGALKNPFFKRYFRNLEKEICQQARGIISMSPAITRHVKAFPNISAVTEVPNFADVDYFSEDRDNPKFRFFDKPMFTLGSVGAIGKANHLDYLVEAARWFHENKKPVGVVIMGEGSEKERLEKLAKGLPNIRFLSFANRPYVKEVLHSIDAAYISYKSIPVLETGSPNRFFDAIAAGRPVITNFGGWVTAIVEKNECGFRTDPTNPADLWNKLHPLLHDNERLEKMKSNALSLALHYTPDKQIKNLSAWLTSTAHIPLEIHV